MPQPTACSACRLNLASYRSTRPFCFTGCTIASTLITCRAELNTAIEHEYAAPLTKLSVFADSGAEGEGDDKFVTGGGR